MSKVEVALSKLKLLFGSNYDIFVLFFCRRCMVT